MRGDKQTYGGNPMNGPVRPARPVLDPDHYAALRGILIVLIVIGHNKFILQSIPVIRPILYNFHVLAFLLLPFIGSVDRLSWGFLGDRLIRYGVPYAWFFTIAASAFWWLSESGIGVADAFVTYLLGLIVGSADLSKEATGFRLYWFLPTLFGLIVARAGLNWIRGRSKSAYWVVLCCGFIGASLMGESIVKWAPFGLPIVGYVIVLGLVVERLSLDGVFDNRRSVFVLIIMIFVLGTAISLSQGSQLILSQARFGLDTSLTMFLLHIVIGLSGFLMVLGAAGLKSLRSSPLLRTLGRHSLIIYLSHSLIFYSMAIALHRLGVIEGYSNGVVGIVVLVLALASGVIISLVINRVPILRRLVLPRGRRDLLGMGA